MALKFALLSLALLSYFSVSVNAACTIVAHPIADTQNLDDSKRVGDIVGVFKITVGEPRATDPVTLDDAGLQEAFRVSVIQLDEPTGNPAVATRAVLLQIGDDFKNWVDVHKRASLVEPKFTLTCADETVAKTPPAFRIQIADTNNNAPNLDGVKGFDFDNNIWKKEDKLNKESLKVLDIDATIADNVISVDAKFEDGEIKQKFQTVKVNQPAKHGDSATFDLLLEEKVPSGKHAVIITARDNGAEGHVSTKTIDINFTGSGAMQTAGALFMVTLFSLISTYISN